MKRHARKAFNQLKKMGVPVFEGRKMRNQGCTHFWISGEHEESYKWFDYYGEFRGGYQWINPQIIQVLALHDLHVEWENPGCVGVYDA